jgi:hypothetical protein
MSKRANWDFAGNNAQMAAPIRQGGDAAFGRPFVAADPNAAARQ